MNNLTSVTIPDSVTSIGEGTFASNKLITIIIPDLVTSIGNEAFANNLLTSVFLPEGVTSIGDQAFRKNDLTSVIIPNSVTSIGAIAFSNNGPSRDSGTITTTGTWVLNGTVWEKSDAEKVAAAMEAIIDGTVDVAFATDQEGKTAAVQSYVDGLLTGDAIGVTAIVTYDNSNYSIALTKGSVKDSKTITMTINVAPDPDIATVSAAKTTAENATYSDMIQEIAIDVETIIAAIKLTADAAINNGDLTTTINEVSYTQSEAGTSANPSGTNGSYEFTITVSKGVVSYITTAKTITITATAYTGVSDVAAVAAAKEAIEIAIGNLTVNNATSDSDILTVATAASLHEVSVAWVGTKVDATSLAAGSITGTLNLTLNGATDTVIVNKTIEQLIYTYTINGDGATITDYLGSSTELIIPATLGGLPVTAIGDYAFDNNGLTSVIIPDGVTSIGEGAFNRNRLTSVTIPNSVTSIGNWAFANNLLTIVTIPNGVTSVGEGAFYRNQLTSVTIPASVTSIGNWAFTDNQLPTVTIPTTVTSIGDEAFAYNQLTTVTIPDSVTSIGQDAFAGNGPGRNSESVTTTGTWVLNGTVWEKRESDAEKVAAAKSAIINGTVDVAFATDQEGKTAAVQSYVDGLLTGDAIGVTAIVTYDNSNYSIALTKGSVNDSKTITMTINVAASTSTRPSSSDTTTSNTSTVIVIVNGVLQNSGTQTKATEDGKLTVTIQVNNQLIEDKINEAIKTNPTGVGNILQVPVADNTSDIAKVNLTGDIIKKLEINTYDVSIKRDTVEYVIPAKEFTISKIAAQLGMTEESLKNIIIEVKIVKLDAAVVAKYEEVAKSNGAQLVISPMEFEITAKTTNTNGITKEVFISKFSNFVERIMQIPAGIDPKKFTTGVVFNSDGTYSHVPTELIEKDGKWFAKVNSLTNSSYSVIWNPITLASVENHWSKDVVNDMASRLIIFNPETFGPNKAITRADFAEYIVRALGLYREGSKHENKFIDVSATGDRTLAILIANEYGIVAGYPDGTFKPDQQITREEAMAMFDRAINVTKIVGVDQNRYQNYSDYGQVGSWATTHVKEVLSAHVFNGTTATTISPKSNLTYAQAAQAIKNLLIESGLINNDINGVLSKTRHSIFLRLITRKIVPLLIWIKKHISYYMIE